ncbi:MAG: signal peptide peptidase SppA, partial [Bacteroidales bacterium]|nr:signal peptide peptidase SppA [Bacteroidales bacterium]
GRVWSGEDALENGLIDLFGGLEKAVEIAAEISGLETYRIVELPKQEDPFELIIKEIAGEAKTKLLKAELGDNYKYIQEFKKLLQFEGIIARIPFDVELE